MSLKSLLFDVDGTLANTEAHGHLPAYNSAFRDLDLDWKWSRKLYRHLLEQPGGRERIAHYIDHYKPNLGAHKDEALSDRSAWVKTVHERKSCRFRERLENGQIPLRDGVARLMTQAYEAGVRIAIVTNASSATLEPFLQHALGPRLQGYVEAIISGEQVTYKKPAPDIYRRACSEIRCYPHECIAIEDSAMGLRAAYAAGVPAIVTTNADTDVSKLEHACLVVDSLGEPDNPVQVLKSPGFDLEYVDLQILERIQAGATQCQAVVSR